MRKLLLCVFILLVMVGCEKGSPKPIIDEQSKSSFSIRFIDVNQADAALVECDGHYMLIDGGSYENSSKLNLLLKDRKIEHLDLLVATNTNDEHIGGFAGVLNNITCDKILCSTDNFESNSFDELKKYADKNNGITVPYEGDYFELGAAGVQVIGVNYGAGNDASIVLRITYGENAFVFASDIEELAENGVINTRENISADVLKIANHGSDFSSTVPFIKRIAPKYAVISVGKDNGKGYPNLDTLKTLQNNNVDIYRTDLHGDILCESDGKVITFTTEKTVDKELLYQDGLTTTNNTQEEITVTMKDLAEANRTTKLINTYGAFRMIVNPGTNSESVSGYYLINNKMAKMMSYGFENSSNVNYDGWFDGYAVFYDQDHMKMFVLVEAMDGEGYPYDYDISYLFTDDKVLELVEETEDAFTYHVKHEGTIIKVIVNKKTLEVQDVYLHNNTYHAKYEYGRQEDCPTILAGWIGQLKTVAVHCQLMVNNELIQKSHEFKIPMDWELIVGSYIYGVESYSDMNFVNPYVYPKDGSDYTVYVTNVKG